MTPPEAGRGCKGGYRLMGCLVKGKESHDRVAKCRCGSRDVNLDFPYYTGQFLWPVSLVLLIFQALHCLFEGRRGGRGV